MNVYRISLCLNGHCVERRFRLEKPEDKDWNEVVLGIADTFEKTDNV